MLSEFDRRTLGAEIAERLAEQQSRSLIPAIEAIIVARIPVPPRAVVTLEESMRYVGRGSRSAFKKWCARWGVMPCSHGRYSRRDLDLGMERESKKTYVHGGRQITR